jgi:TP901 family phage tail tape measure protein
MINAGVIQAYLRLKDVNFRAGLAKARVGMAAAGKQFSAVGKKMRNVGRTMTTRVTAPLMLIGAASIKMAADFETGLTKMITLVGLSSDEVNAFKQDILDLSGETAKSPKELADAMFFITSAGLRGADAIEALTASAKASALGLGETEVIADAVTSAMNAYGVANLSATRATNIMALAVREGKLEASQLAPVLGRLLPTASAMGVEFEQVAGILAVMSRTGLDAAEASTSLSSIMTTLLKPTTQAKKALDSVGLSHADLRATAAGPDGLIAVMRKLSEAFADDDEALVQVVPNVRAFRGVMNVLAQDAEVVGSVMRGVATDVDVLSEGMAELEKTTGFKIKRAFTNLGTAFLKMGDVMVPVVEKIVAVVERWADRLNAMTPAQRKLTLVVAGFAAAIGPVLSALGMMSMGIGSLLTLLGGGAAAGAVAGGATLMGGLSAVVAFMTGPVGLTIAVAAVLLSWKPFRDFLKSIGKLFLEVAKSVVALIAKYDILKKVGKVLSVMFAGHIVAFKAFRKVLNFTTGAATAAAGGLKKFNKELKYGKISVESQRIATESLALATEELFRQKLQATITAELERGEIERGKQAIVEQTASVNDLVAAYVPLTEEQLAKAVAGFQAVKEKVADLIDKMRTVTAVSVEFDVALPKITGSQHLLNAALANTGIIIPDVAAKMTDLRRVVDGNVASTAQLKDHAQSLYDEFVKANKLTPELRAELEALGAVNRQLEAETSKAAEAAAASTAEWNRFFGAIKTGIGWVDQLVSGVFKLIDSLMKKEGLKGALGGIGEMISGVFGGTGSKLGQVAGGIVSKLGGFDFGKLFGGLGGAAAGAGGGGFFSAAGMMKSFSSAGGMAGIFGGGAAAGGAAAGGLAGLMSGPLSILTGPWGMAGMAILSTFGPQIMEGLKVFGAKVGKWVKGLFGPDEAELDARKIKASINELFDSVIDSSQAAETAGIRWKINNVIVRDSYLAIGKSQAEADAAMKRLADTSKQSPAQAKETVDAIVAIVEQVKKSMEETGLTMTELRNRNVNAAIVAAKAGATAFDTLATAAVTSATKVKSAFDSSLGAVKDAAVATATKVKESFDLDLTGPVDRLSERMRAGINGSTNPQFAFAGGGDTGGGNGAGIDHNSARIEALIERLPTIMERSVKHALQTSGRQVRG